MSTAEILANREYKYGWVTDIESETIPRGLSEDTVRLISAKKDEPEWLLEFRLKAYRNWLTMAELRNWQAEAAHWKRTAERLQRELDQRG